MNVFLVRLSAVGSERLNAFFIALTGLNLVLFSSDEAIDDPDVDAKVDTSDVDDPESLEASEVPESLEANENGMEKTDFGL